MKRLALLTALLVAACGGKSKPAPAPAPAPAEPAPPAPAPEEAKRPPPPDDSVLAQSKLAEQYQVGKEVFDKECASCHGEHGEGNAKNPALVGDGALPEKATFKGAKLRKNVTFTTAKDVFDFEQANMPLGKKGKQDHKLTDDQYLAVLAWNLNENKVALDHPLATDNLASIKLR